MHLPNSANQRELHRAFRADGTLAGTNTPQLILPVALSRCMLMVMNIGAHAMYLEHGPARFSVTISSGKVSAVTVVNGGFGYTMAPSIEFWGGFGPYVANSVWTGLGLIGSPPPSGLANQGDTTNPAYNRPAKAHCVLSNGVVASVVIDDPGFGYINPPEAGVKNSGYDPFGCASPYYGSVSSGIYLPAAGGFYYINGTSCWTDAIAISGTAADAFTVEYMI